MEVIRIEEVKQVDRDHKNHFFDADTIRFFNSRVSDRAYKVGDKAYFITSERSKIGNQPRKWSIRVIDLTTGNIRTVGQFQEFNSSKEAKAELKRILA